MAKVAEAVKEKKEETIEGSKKQAQSVEFAETAQISKEQVGASIFF